MLLQSRPSATLMRMEIAVGQQVRIADVDRGAPLCHSAQAAIDWASCQKTTTGQIVLRDGALVVRP